jgi:hypothetical protein
MAARETSTPSEQWLRAFVLVVGAAGAPIIAALAWYISVHADPKAGGMEFGAIPAAIGLIFLPLSVPALILGGINRLLSIGAFFAVLSIIAYGWYWVQVTEHLTHGL